MLYFLLTIFVGMLPEVIYFTLFLIYTKNIKTKKVKLFFLIMVVYILCILLDMYKIIYYIMFIFLIYLVLKILYKDKTQIIDIFIINVAFIYVCFISYICFLFVKNNVTIYYIMTIINKILLFLPFIFKNKFYKLYKKYCSLWNRNDKENRPIKSITLRNISFISLNLFIFICDIVCLYILNLKG